jgi:hypothetical protein
MGIAVTREVYGCVLREKPEKHTHPYPLSREIPMNHNVLGYSNINGIKGRRDLFREKVKIQMEQIASLHDLLLLRTRVDTRPLQYENISLANPQEHKGSKGSL